MEMKGWDCCVAFHGHECPGLAIGVKACEAAVKKIGLRYSEDEEIVCVTENDACGADAVQVIAGCTFGKGNLIYRGTGKMAFSFFNRVTGESVRMLLRPLAEEMDRKQCQQYILNADVEELFAFSIPDFDVPEKARLFSTVRCESCGEGAPEHKIRLSGGKKVCLDCIDKYSRGF